MSPKLSSGSAQLAREPLTIEVEAQQVLDELLAEKAIPFTLNVGKITKGIGEYTIHFHDSRIFTASVPLTKSHSFRDLVRSAVLSRVAELSGPLKNWQKKT
jgi:hypothetical protein